MIIFHTVSSLQSLEDCLVSYCPSYLVCAADIIASLASDTMKYKTKVESVQLGNTYIADIDKCPQDKCCLDKCCGDSYNLYSMFPGPTF